MSSLIVYSDLPYLYIILLTSRYQIIIIPILACFGLCLLCFLLWLPTVIIFASDVFFSLIFSKFSQVGNVILLVNWSHFSLKLLGRELCKSCNFVGCFCSWFNYCFLVFSPIHISGMLVYCVEYVVFPLGSPSFIYSSHVLNFHLFSWLLFSSYVYSIPFTIVYRAGLEITKCLKLCLL